MLPMGWAQGYFDLVHYCFTLFSTALRLVWDMQTLIDSPSCGTAAATAGMSSVLSSFLGVQSSWPQLLPELSALILKTAPQLAGQGRAEGPLPSELGLQGVQVAADDAGCGRGLVAAQVRRKMGTARTSWAVCTNLKGPIACTTSSVALLLASICFDPAADS